MVSKVAVMALVGILAIPILLGYGMNLTETTETIYTPENNSVNVTQLLQNSIRYSNTHADVYQLNSNFKSGYQYPISIVPVFNTINSNSNASSLILHQEHVLTNNATGPLTFPDVRLFAWDLNYDPDISYVYGTITYGPDNTTTTINKIKSVFYNSSTSDVAYFKLYTGGTVTINNPTYLYLYTTNTSQTIDLYYSISYIGLTEYVNLSDGYHFYETDPVSNTDARWFITMPNHTKSVLFTIDLDSITDANYSCRFYTTDLFDLVKTTTDGNVSWQVKFPSWVNGAINNPEQTIDLYYDPTISHNTYQISVDVGDNWYDYYNSYLYTFADVKYDFNYVGDWPSYIGKSNTYKQYTVNRTEMTRYSINPEIYIYNVAIGRSAAWLDPLDVSPTIRLDDAYLAGFESPAIEDRTYTPTEFKTNPSTTLSKVKLYGRSITFGGQTYTVDSNGDITLGTHNVNVDGLVFDSVPIAGGYENRINGNVINTSATPSTITFGGKWDLSVDTDSITTTTKTLTEWVPGQFAWNGIDQNFLMVGLISVMGVFVAVGIYARIHRMSIWPLLFVCGGAAALFLFMI